MSIGSTAYLDSKPHSVKSWSLILNFRYNLILVSAALRHKAPLPSRRDASTFLCSVLDSLASLGPPKPFAFPPQRLRLLGINVPSHQGTMPNHIVSIQLMPTKNVTASRSGKSLQGVPPRGYGESLKHDVASWRDVLVPFSRRYRHLFITFTCNPRWTELDEAFAQVEHGNRFDCIDLPTRLFHSKCCMGLKPKLESVLGSIAWMTSYEGAYRGANRRTDPLYWGKSIMVLGL